VKIFPTTKILLKWDIVASVDLTPATARVFIDDKWHTLSWLTNSVAVGNNFMRTAGAVVGGADTDALIKLTYRQDPLVEVSINDEALVTSSGLVGVY
jgi:hypothetical protein